MRRIGICILLITTTGFNLFAQDTLRINSSQQFQTIEGWGHGGGILGGTQAALLLLDSSISNPVNYQMLDYLVDELGLSGTRIWEVGPRLDGTGMDQGDCDSIDWTKFQSSSLTPGAANYLVYYKNRILSKGYQPSFYSSPGYATHASDLKPWVLNHPGERAQQIWASALYLKNTYGININYCVLYNEPSGTQTSTILTEEIKALGPRLVARGLNTRAQFAEAVTPQSDWNFIVPVQNDTALWNYVGRISYHNYGTADPYRTYIRDFGLSKGIRTAQTEMGNPGFDDLYNDLTLGGVSYWEVAYASQATLAPDTGLTFFTPSATFFRVRQLLHYVQPGSTRIECNSNNASVRTLSFIKNGAVTTVIENTSPSARTIFLSGLPAGNYGISKATPSSSLFTESGIQTVGAGGTLSLVVAGSSAVTTLYPYSGTNQAPCILSWKSTPGYILSPNQSALLSVQANDAELNTLTYLWSVYNKPSGSNPLIVSPTASNTQVNGMTLPGTYVFQIQVSDGVYTRSKKLYLVVYGAKPPPVLGGAGFRIASPYGLVFGNPGDTTHAQIELPASSLTLQVNISDIANSDFSGRGTWSLVQQPTGANAIVGGSTYIYLSIRANVSGMNVPGDYVFKVVVTNPGYADLTAQVVCTVNPASLAPVISSINTFPASLTMPFSDCLLSAVTTDPESDLLRHWWVIKSAPSGAQPIFDHQGLKTSQVRGLTIPGNYTFTLRAFDDLHMTTRDVSITVNPGSTATLNISPSTLQFTPSASSQKISISSNTNWNLGSTPSWLNIDKVFGTGNDSITISVSVNPDSISRTTIVGCTAGSLVQYISIRQDSMPATNDQLSINPDTIIAPHIAYATQIQLQCNRSWSTINPVSWVSITPLTGNGDSLIQVNIGSNLSSGIRETDILFMTGSKNSILHIRQDALNGIENKKFQNYIRIYPNPSEGLFTIENTDMEMYRFQILDPNGKILDTLMVDANSRQLYRLPDGFYLFRIESENGFISHRKILIIK